jgi:hypothetical protein
MIRALNGSILFIGGLPGAVTGGISITEIQLILIFLMIISLFLFFLKKRSWLLMSFLVTLIFFQAENLRRDEGRGTRAEFVVYKAGGMTVADFLYGDRSLLMRSDPSEEMGDFFRSVLTDHWIHKGIRKRSTAFLGEGNGIRPEWDHPLLPLYRNGNFFLLGDKRIYFLRSTIPPVGNTTLTLDYLVIGGDVMNELREILQVFNPGMIILDSSCKRWRCREWMKEASLMNIKVYSVSEEGAFRVELLHRSQG